MQEPSAQTDAELMARLAAEHLPTDVARQWLSVLKPAVRLMPARADGQPCVARLGGEPLMPPASLWPTWPEHGPLSYIGELHCDQLEPFSLDIILPATGRLLLFYYDGPYYGSGSIADSAQAIARNGGRALYLPDSVEAQPMPTPDGIATYREMRFAGQQIVSAPPSHHPDLADARGPFGDDREARIAAAFDGLAAAIYEHRAGPIHQIGGYADSIQAAVEDVAADTVLGEHVSYADPRQAAEAARWELLVQIDTDVELDMMWGDSGLLYWMARPQDLAAGDIDQILFITQSN